MATCAFSADNNNKSSEANTTDIPSTPSAAPSWEQHPSSSHSTIPFSPVTARENSNLEFNTNSNSTPHAPLAFPGDVTQDGEICVVQKDM
jgi:hypothetical protein